MKVCLAQGAGKRAGLAQTPRHERVAFEEIRDLGRGEAVQNAMPPGENHTQLLPVRNHPSPKIPKPNWFNISVYISEIPEILFCWMTM